jgi:hypothetical protein
MPWIVWHGACNDMDKTNEGRLAGKAQRRALPVIQDEGVPTRSGAALAARLRCEGAFFVFVFAILWSAS